MRCAGQVAEADPKNRELMARQENALQQLVLMALNDNTTVVEQACATLREWAPAPGHCALWGCALQLDAALAWLRRHLHL